MAPEAIAGGPLGLEPAPLREDEIGVEAEIPQISEGPETQSPATEDQTFTRAQVEEIIKEATADMVSRDEMEINVGKVRSSLDRARNEERAQWAERDARYQETIHNMNLRDMDEDSRAKYERDVYLSRSQELQERLIQQEAELEATKQVGPYLRNLVDGFGIQLTDVDLSDIDSLSQSAFDAAQTAHKELKAERDKLMDELATLRGATGDETETRTAKVVNSPDVVTEVGQTVSSPTTIFDLRKSVSQRMGLDHVMTEEQLFELAERPEESGVDMNVVVQALEETARAESEI
jgi:hypothetical protein